MEAHHYGQEEKIMLKFTDNNNIKTWDMTFTQKTLEHWQDISNFVMIF